MDCFGPFLIKVGRWQEKRWGILFKCLTMHCIHVGLLTSLDTNRFLLSFSRFVAYRWNPCEVNLTLTPSDHFVRGCSSGAFDQLTCALQEAFERCKVCFLRNTQHDPHFRGVWKRDVRPIKYVLCVTSGNKTVTEEVLRTFLNRSRRNPKSCDTSNPDQVTFLMGRLEVTIPHVIFAHPELLGIWRWLHSEVLAEQFWSSFIKHYLSIL